MFDKTFIIDMLARSREKTKPRGYIIVSGDDTGSGFDGTYVRYGISYNNQPVFQNSNGDFQLWYNPNEWNGWCISTKYGTYDVPFAHQTNKTYYTEEWSYPANLTCTESWQI